MAIENQPRFLFVGADAKWQALAAAAARHRGAILDVEPDVPAALGRMLRPGPVYGHVLAVAPLRSKAIDALAGMLDEVTLQPTPLLLLGCISSFTAAPVPCVGEATEAAVEAALARATPSPPKNLAPMLPDELVDALHAGSLRMRFQPILRALDMAPIGLEALARLHHSQRGILHPKDFIPLTTACGRERVLTSIAAIRTFLEIGTTLRQTGLFVTVNLPLSIVMHEYSVRRGVELCTVAGVKPKDIMIEVLETRTAPDLGLLSNALQAWREAGFRTAIDDAGPALPHWRDLLDLPFDALKLDGALVSDPAQHELLATIVAEARARGRFTVAEGIENEADLERVQGLGVDALQGFLFSRPLPALAVPIWLGHWKARVRVAA